MEKEQIKNKIFEYFEVSDFGELIAKTPKEWMDCCNSILSQDVSPFEKAIAAFPEEWKIYFRQIIDGYENYVDTKDSPLSWLGNIESTRHDKFLLFLYQTSRESDAFAKQIIKNNLNLRELVWDFYSLTHKEFKNKYGISNIR